MSDDIGIDQSTVIFFDASCLFTAAGSPSGGSGFLVSVCHRGFLSGATSQGAILEARRRIATKLGNIATERFDEFVVPSLVVLVPIPSSTQRARLDGLINPKDQHVVAAALILNAQFVITHDLSLVEEVRRASISVEALTPGDFLTDYLPLHRDFFIIRG